MPTPLADALTTACDRYGLDTTGAELIHHYNNAVYLLPAVPAIARVATGNDPARLRVTQTVTAWLGEEGFGATTPLPSTELVEIDDTTCVTFWTYYPQPDAEHAEPLGSRHLGTLLKALHSTDQPPAELADWTPLESLGRALKSGAAAQALSPDDLDWLTGYLGDLRTEVSELSWPLGYGLVHGDAWAGNLLWDTSTDPATPILCDWDSVSRGPREVDLIPTWHAATRYGRDEVWIQAFVDEYGYDLRDWDGYKTLIAMRDLAQVPGPIRQYPKPAYAAVLRQRLTAIRTGDRTNNWVAL
ncbi:aminoglycoside phosphotransferase family protein [Kribbella sp. NBC_01245]|uniref:aminoglycoside phosphotransferase family protein n=1 Tax=Kribbella sp. NBC_01245 TaxID=2903578 RepID=UPI002E280333|nr:aminoglycoside phosphotransferase family protein [Kribbella sp. NBC_01245]